MIWHIFKKDLRLLWLFAVAIAFLPFAIVAIHLKMDHYFEENGTLEALLLLLELMFYFGTATLTAVLVHQDGLADARQDWLVRPIRRRDLLAAKLLFVALAAQLPLFLADVTCGLVYGFAIPSVLTASLTENLYFLLGFALPIFAFVSLTKNLTESLGGAFALFMAVMGLEFLIAAGRNSLDSTTGTGIEWIPQTERLLIYFLAAAAILGLQYFRRALRLSRYVLGGAIALCVLTQLAPWRYFFGIEKAISAEPERNPLIQFDPALGKFHSPVDSDSASGGTQFNRRGSSRVVDMGAEIYLPLEVSGIEGGSILKIDRASVSLLGANGKDGGAINLSGEPGRFEVTNTGTSENSSITYFEPIRIRSNIFNRIKNTPVMLRVEYSATSLGLTSTASLPTAGANLRIPGAGWCETELNNDKTAVEVRCLSAGYSPQCGTLFLENSATGARNPAVHGCIDDYSPYFGRYKPPDLILPSGFNLNFRDPAGLLHYPVDATQIGAARIVLKTYFAVGHFTQQLTIPSIRLADWSAL